MPAQVPERRKRLTVGTGATRISTSNTQGEDAHSTIARLRNTDVMAQLPRKGRRGSIGAQTDRKLNHHGDFNEKEKIEDGDRLTPQCLSSMGIGIVCKKGRKPEGPNQDSFSFLHVEGVFDLFVVYDGHGPNGHDVSNFAREFLPKLFVNNRLRETDPGSALVEAFEDTQSLITAKLDAATSGCTCTALYHPKVGQFANTAFVAHVGDSRCVLATTGPDGSVLEAEDLTIDHKPELQQERARIEAAGGRVQFDGYYNHRVYSSRGDYPGLNMSRALGDIIAHQQCGLIATPDVREVDLNNIKSGIILLCTDGVWEFIASKAALNTVASFSPGKCQEAVEKLALDSWKSWMADSHDEISDDITAVMIRIENK